MSRRDVHRNRCADRLPANASPANGREPVVRLLDAIDRAHLTPMDVLLLLHVAEADATVVDLAERLDRRPIDVRRATGRLVARGLLRRRSDTMVRRGVMFAATTPGLDVLARLEAPSSLAGPATAGAGRPPRLDARFRPLGPGRTTSGQGAMDGDPLPR